MKRSGEEPGSANVMLHDFGYRGAAPETAGLGGAAHLVHFRTSTRSSPTWCSASTTRPQCTRRMDALRFRRRH